MSGNRSTFTCSTCDKDFPTKSQLISHDIRKHGSNSNYKSCKQCNYKTVYNHDLLRHLKKHKNEKQYQCLVCRSGYSNEKSLQVHMKSIHSDKKPYKCRTCHSKFNTNRELIIHQRHHGLLKQHLCTVCNTEFTTRAHLKDHERIHTGERPYECNECDSKFSRSSSLKKHLWKIHGHEKPSRKNVRKHQKSSEGLHLPKIDSW